MADNGNGNRARVNHRPGNSSEAYHPREAKELRALWLGDDDIHLAKNDEDESTFISGDSPRFVELMFFLLVGWGARNYIQWGLHLRIHAPQRLYWKRHKWMFTEPDGLGGPGASITLVVHCDEVRYNKAVVSGAQNRIWFPQPTVVQYDPQAAEALPEVTAEWWSRDEVAMWNIILGYVTKTEVLDNDGHYGRRYCALAEVVFY